MTREDETPKPEKGARGVRIRPLEVAIPADTLRPLHDRLTRVVAEQPELADVVASMCDPSSEEDG